MSDNFYDKKFGKEWDDAGGTAILNIVKDLNENDPVNEALVNLKASYIESRKVEVRMNHFCDENMRKNIIMVDRIEELQQRISVLVNEATHRDGKLKELQQQIQGLLSEATHRDEKLKEQQLIIEKLDPSSGLDLVETGSPRQSVEGFTGGKKRTRRKRKKKRKKRSKKRRKRRRRR
jgi:hypothetical protein